MSEPREWWIHTEVSAKNISNNIELFTATKERPQNPGWSHVIEKSAYDALKAEVERLVGALKRYVVYPMPAPGPIGNEAWQAITEYEKWKAGE
jgi:hypothetical protein